MKKDYCNYGVRRQSKTSNGKREKGEGKLRAKGTKRACKKKTGRKRTRTRRRGRDR